MTPSSRRIWFAWLPALIWLGFIAIESTDNLSAANTGRFLYPLLHALFGIGIEKFAVIHHYIRKSGHFVGYFTLSLLLFRAWRATLPRRPVVHWCLRWATVAFLMTALVASLDEWHQTFIPSRTGTIWDVLLDSSAALVAQVLIFLFLGLVGRSSPRREAQLYAD